MNKIITSVAVLFTALAITGCGPSYEAVKPSVLKAPKYVKVTNSAKLDKLRSYSLPYLNSNIGIIDMKVIKSKKYGNLIAYLKADKTISFMQPDKKRPNNMFGFQDIAEYKNSIEDINLKSYIIGDNVFDLSSEYGIAFIADKRRVAIAELSLKTVPRKNISPFITVFNSELKKISIIPKNKISIFKTKSDVLKIAFVPNSKYILVLTSNDKISLWDIKTKKMIKTIVSHKSKITNIKLSNTGNLLSYSDKGKLYIFDMKKNESIVSFEQRGTTSIAFSKNEKIIASTGDFANIILYNINKNKPFKYIKHNHQGFIYGLMFDPQDDNILLSAGEDGKLKTWFLKDTKHPTSIKYYSKAKKRICNSNFQMKEYLSGPSKEYNNFISKYKPKYTSCNVLGNKQQIIDFSNKGILNKFIDANYDALLNRYPKVKQEWVRLAYLSNHDFMSSEYQNNVNNMTYNKLNKKQKLAYSKFSEKNKAFLYALNAGSYYGLLEMDNEIFGYGTGIKENVYYESNKKLNPVNQSDYYFRFNANNLVQTYAIFHKIEFFNGRGRYDEILVKNNHEIIAAKDNIVEIWDYDNYTLKDIITENGRIYSLAYDSQNNYLAIGSSSKVIKVWDLNSMKLIKKLSGHTQNIISLKFINDGQNLISAAYDKTARIWDMKTNKTIEILTGFERSAGKVRLSPDEKTFIILSVGDLDSEINIYDSKKFTLLKKIAPKIGTIAGIEFTKDTNNIIAISSGHTFEKKKGHIAIAIDSNSYKEIKRSYFSVGYSYAKGLILDENKNLIIIAGSGRYLTILDLKTLKKVGNIDNGAVKYGSSTIDAIGKTKDNNIITGNRQGNLNILYVE